MANIREIKARMKSVNDILKITNAMYLISSSKMKKAKQMLDDTEPYFYTLQNTIGHILRHTPHTGNVFFARREEIPPEKRKKGYLIITADKGLCGAYNHNVLHLAEEEISKGGGDVKLFIIGQVGRIYFSRKGIPHEEYFRYTAQNPTMFRAREISELLLGKFLSGDLDDLYVIFTDSISGVKEETKIMQILPFKRVKFESFKKSGTPHILHTATFDPSPKEVMDHLVPNFAKGLIYGAMVEAYASEQSARMMAMENATNSAKDMIGDLNLEYNRARQAAITQEITEIVSGANALKK